MLKSDVKATKTIVLLMKDELELRRMIIDTFDFISASMLSE
jgi:hypothetical protein